MLVSLERPLVFDGEVNSALLDTLEELHGVGDLYIDEGCEHQVPLYEEIAQLGDVQLGAEWTRLGRSSLIQPGQSQVGYPNSQWHAENNSGLLVSDRDPTEFLLAEEDVLANFVKTRLLGIRQSNPVISDQDMANFIANQANRMSDQELRAEGFEIWAANPLEVVALGPLDIHRSTANPLQTAVYRNHAMLFRSLAETQAIITSTV